MNAMKRAAQLLKTSGHRVTRTRIKIIEYLATSDEPRSIHDITSALHADEVTVYRTIPLMVELGIFEEIYVGDGLRFYALKEEHHDHVVCERCHSVMHIPCTQKHLPSGVRTPAFKKITGHTIMYTGICAACVRSSK